VATTVESPTSAMPSTTGVPGLTRRRVWASPDVLSHAVVVLTLPKLYLSQRSATPAELLGLDSGGEVEPVVGPDAEVVELQHLHCVTLHLLTNTVRFEGRGPATTVTLRTYELADALFTKVWRRLGDGYAIAPHRPAFWDVARGPLVFLGGVWAATGCLALTLSAAEDMAAGGNPALAAVLPGWPAVCTLAGAAAAGVTVFVARRLTRPPDRLLLERRDTP
jgi:hypothetical protein